MADEYNLSVQINTLQGQIAQAEATYLADSSLKLEALQTQNKLLKEVNRLLDARYLERARISGSKLAVSFNSKAPVVFIFCHNNRFC